MEKSIVKINPADYGLNETKARQIEKMFSPMLDKMVELETEFNEVAKLEISSETCEKARELRLKYRKVRTGTAAIHKELKAFYLNGGRFVDGWKNAQLFASEGMEVKLKAIENHFEIIEAEKINKIQEQRAAELSKYDVDFIPDNLGIMPDDVWNNFLLGTKTNYNAQKEAERKAEEDRIAREKAEAIERERIQKDNARLLKEAEAKEKADKIEADKRARVEADRVKREEVEHKARDEKERKERETRAKLEADRLKKALAERKIQDAKLQKERNAKAKAEAELQARKDAERLAEEQRIARIKAGIEAELNKGDAAKVRDLVLDITSLKSKYQFKSKKNQKMYSDVNILLDKIVDFIN